jgi:hypothetical protein
MEGISPEEGIVEREPFGFVSASKGSPREPGGQHGALIRIFQK